MDHIGNAISTKTVTNTALLLRTLCNNNVTDCKYRICTHFCSFLEILFWIVALCALCCCNHSNFPTVSILFLLIKYMVQCNICAYSVLVAATHLFNSEVIYEMVVVLIEAAVQRYTVRMDEQILQGCHTLQA